MNLQQQIKKDLVTAMKAKDEATKNTLRVIMGEFARQPEKDISDDDVIKIIKKLVKSEKEVMDKSNTAEPSPFMQVAAGYLPKMASEEEITAWIAANIDFEAFKNKMQAMKPIMQHFGDRADGNLVKQILSGM